jgi:hypothetical protein
MQRTWQIDFTRTPKNDPKRFFQKKFHIKNGISTMASAKAGAEQALKRALAIQRNRRDGDRDRLALLLTHSAGMRVCVVAALTRVRGSF